MIVFFKRFINSPFLLQGIIWSFVVFLFMGIRPQVAYSDVHADLYMEERAIESISIVNDIFLKVPMGNDLIGLEEIESVGPDGEVSKTLVREGREEEIFHTIRSGDTVAKLARDYNLKQSTILWANDMDAKQPLVLGESVRIPPIDGIYYTVKENDTLEDIVEEHSGKMTEVKSFNPHLKTELVKVDEEIFIPKSIKVYIAQKPDPEPEPTPVVVTKTAEKPVVAITTNEVKSVSTAVSATTIAPKPSLRSSSTNVGMIRPTVGVLTQGYHRGHLALDLASGMDTPIKAAASGTVVRSYGNGAWNQGYGNYIMIDHGNGIQTLYGHNNQVYVSVGDYVTQGTVIAGMGNTGRVFGVTGIHLHFEVRVNGVQKNPWNYID